MLTTRYKKLYNERIKRLRVLYPDEMIAILDHFATSDLYRNSTGYRVIALNKSDIGRDLNKRKGEARNEAFLHFVSMWDTLNCWAKQDLDAAYEKRKLDPAAPEDHSEKNTTYLMADVAHQLIKKLFGTRLLRNSYAVTAQPERGYDFAKKLRFNNEQLAHFATLLFEIADHVQRGQRIWLSEWTGGTDIFVNFVRLLECQPPT
ncbi:MAG: hypothetical protein AAGF95_16710, partial [Chloroflexota bacterium]